MLSTRKKAWKHRSWPWQCLCNLSLCSSKCKISIVLLPPELRVLYMSILKEKGGKDGGKRKNIAKAVGYVQVCCQHTRCKLDQLELMLCCSAGVRFLFIWLHSCFSMIFPFKRNHRVWKREKKSCLIQCSGRQIAKNCEVSGGQSTAD